MSTALTFLPAPVGMRPFPVLSDNMEPTLHRDGFAFVVPVDRYQGAGIYVVADACGGLTLYRCDTPAPGVMLLWSDNPRYSRWEITPDDFAGMVVAKAAVAVNVVDRPLVDRCMGGVA